MELVFFCVPVLDPRDATVALNRFLATHPQARIEKQLIDAGLDSVWSVCVTVPPHSVDAPPAETSDHARPRNSKKVDYRAILTPHQWERYRLLREFRKQVTTRDGLPAYAMALNEQLAEIVTRCPVSLAELTQVAGFGQARVEKYGQMLLEQLRIASESFPDPPASSPAAASSPSPAAAPPPSAGVAASTSPAN